MATSALRPGRPDDVEAITRIYNHAVRSGVATFDLQEQGRSYGEQLLDHDDSTRPLWVATVGSQVVGYAYAGSYRARPAYDATRETSIYLAPEWVGRGIGRELYAALLSDLDAAGCHTALALVALPNPASVRLHEAVGFTRIGTMREVGRKHGRWVDTAWYQRFPPDKTLTTLRSEAPE